MSPGPLPGAMHCPLCAASGARPFARVRQRDYFRCAACHLTFLAPEQRPDPAAERARYATHRNDPTDPGYRAFLDRLASPLAERLPPSAEGLDYGSGPGPTLSLMMEERGFPMRTYDPFFHPDADALLRTYAFITCSEVVEHFFSPGAEFDRLDGLLRAGGWLGIMTEILRDDAAFAGWWYVRDLTHVAFYRPETMAWIAARYGWQLDAPGKNVVLFRKSPARA